MMEQETWQAQLGALQHLHKPSILLLSTYIVLLMLSKSCCCEVPASHQCSEHARSYRQGV